MYKLAILTSHPIQYFAPLYKYIAAQPDIDLTVYYCSRQGVDTYFDTGFRKYVQWDIPLLEDYNYKFLDNMWKTHRPKGAFGLINPGILRVLYKGRYDALWMHGYRFVTYMMALGMAKILRIPVLLSGDTTLLKNRTRARRLLRKFTLTFLFKQYSAFLTVGSYNEAYYRAHGASEDKLFLVPFAVNNDFFINESKRLKTYTPQLREEIKIPPHVPVILSVGKLTRQKRPMDLLNAYHKLVQSGAKASLVYVGSGPELENLQSYKDDNGLLNVHFLGFQNQSEMPKFYAISDIFAFPASNEAWGLVINEAMCAGLPIIASKEIGAVPNLVKPGKNGFVFQAGDIDALTSYLNTLCTQPDLRCEMGQASLAIIRNWSYEEDMQGLRVALASVKASTNVVLR